MRLPTLQLNDTSRHRALLGIAGAVILAVLVTFALFKRANGNTGKTPVPAATSVALPVELLASDLSLAERRELARGIPLTGDLQARNQSVVKAKVAGDIGSFSVREGETVGAGQIVARIDTTEADARLAEKLADLEAAKAQLGLAEKNRANQQELLAQKFISQNAYDSTVSNLLVADAKLKAVQAQVALARKALDDTAVRAPIGGVVAQRFAQPGEKVSVDTRILSIIDLSELEVEAAVPASDIPSIRIGQDVSFHIEGFGAREFKGRIARINPEARAGTRSILVYAIIPNRDRALRSGMFAKGEVTISRSKQAWVVPLGAVRDDGQGPFVYAVRDGKIERRSVKVGLRDEDKDVAEILAGVDAPIQVVKANLGALMPGSTATVVEPAKK